jgi:murein DD-endopeptidase MepM/ murein hydrolase activator NlpD
MTLLFRKITSLTVLCSLGWALPLAAQMAPKGEDLSESVCPRPAIDRFTTHTSTSGETLAQIAQRHNLSIETLLGVNRSVRTGAIAAGSAIVIPPFNGIRVNVPPGMLLRDAAKKYKVRADVLFEVNGCQPNPREIFVPGITWTPALDQTAPPIVFALGYPLPKSGSVLTPFGFRVGDRSSVETHSGVDLAASLNSPVLAVADGTIAFTGSQGSLGTVIVINHIQGYQTRYAHLAEVQVKRGQQVRRGDAIAIVGQSGSPSAKEPHLHFEVRSNSKLGWVAEDPLPLLGQK